MTLEDMKEFLELRVPEGTRLDYKEAWDDELVKHVAALANTQGGHVLVGVAEDRRLGPGGVRLNVPKSDNIPGVAHRARAWRPNTAIGSSPPLSRDSSRR